MEQYFPQNTQNFANFFSADICEICGKKENNNATDCTNLLSLFEGLRVTKNLCNLWQKECMVKIWRCILTTDSIHQ